MVGLAQRAELQRDPVSRTLSVLLLVVAEKQVVGLADGALAVCCGSGIAKDHKLHLCPEVPVVQAGSRSVLHTTAAHYGSVLTDRCACFGGGAGTCCAQWLCCHGHRVTT